MDDGGGTMHDHEGSGWAEGPSASLGNMCDVRTANKENQHSLIMTHDSCIPFEYEQTMWWLVAAAAEVWQIGERCIGIGHENCLAANATHTLTAIVPAIFVSC